MTGGPNDPMDAMKTRIEVDPTELLPGDIVIELNDHDLSGCHCDVLVTVEREQP